MQELLKKDCTLFMYIFKGTDNVGTYAFLNEVVSIADLVAYRNVLIINLVSSRKQPWVYVPHSNEPDNRCLLELAMLLSS